MKRPFLVTLILLLAVVATFAAPKEAPDYSKRIVSRWLGSRKFAIFHANGTWGIQRNEDSPEDIDGRRWRIQGNKLFMTFRGDHGFQTTEFTIISFSPQKFITEVDGHKETYDRSPQPK